MNDKLGPEDTLGDGPPAPREAGSDAAALVNALRDLHGVQAIPLKADGAYDDASGSGALALPAGLKVVDLTKFLDRRLPRPRRARGAEDHDTVASFVAAVDRYKGDTKAAVVFAARAEDRSSASLEAVFDYDVDASTPGWREHRAQYAFPLSPEWRAWILGTASPFTQGRFAEFLEDHVIDVVDPERLPADGAVRQAASAAGFKLGSGSAVLALSRGLAVNVDGKVIQDVNLATGETKLSFEETHTTTKSKTGGQVEVPQAFVVSVPVFEGGDSYAVLVRLRYRVGPDRSITWGLLPHRATAVFDDAFAGAITTVEKATGVPVFRGAAALAALAVPESEPEEEE